jgi:hypothetical protein
MVQTVPKTDKSSEPMPESLLYIPGFVVFGTATPERFRRALTVDMIEGGLASRCIILESDERRRGQKAREVDEMSDDILERATY